jgi:hypothetical protein
MQPNAHRHASLVHTCLSFLRRGIPYTNPRPDPYVADNCSCGSSCAAHCLQHTTKHIEGLGRRH